MKNIISTIGFLLICIPFTQAQNNGIFNGGSGEGSDQLWTASRDNSDIFEGGDGDGFSHLEFVMPSNSSIFGGGNGDGYSTNKVSTKSNNEIFAGGTGDGFDSERFAQSTNNNIFAGGAGDGFDKMTIASKTNNNIFAGGSGDGFDVSRISKLIWTGAVNEDWLVAGNWNISRTPTRYDQVSIPAGAPNYPHLNGKLLVNDSGDHTYTCSSISILTNGIINGNTETWLENNGVINVAGQLILQRNNLHQHINYGEGTIKVLTGGLIEVLF